MRQLIYDCYSKEGNKEKTVLSLALANEWKNNNKNNYVKENFINISEEEAFNKKEKKDEQEQWFNEILIKRFLTIKKRIENNKNKHN